MGGAGGWEGNKRREEMEGRGNGGEGGDGTRLNHGGGLNRNEEFNEVRRKSRENKAKYVA